MSFNRGLVVIVALLSSLAVVSCGGGKSDGGESSATTRAEGTTQAGSAPAGEAKGDSTEPTKGKQAAGSKKGEGGGPGKSAPPVEKPSTTPETAGGAGNAGTAKEDAPQSSGNQFRRKAKAVCSRARRKLFREVGVYLKKQGAQGQSQKALLAVSRNVLIPGMEGQIAEIRSVEPPPASTPGANAFLGAWQRALASAARESKPLVGKHAKTVLAPVGRQARRVGLSACAYG